MPMAGTYDYSNYGSWKGVGAVRKWRPNLPNRYVRFLSEVDRSKPVVELGCADGSFMKAMRQVGFTDVRGIDLCPEYAGCPDVEIGDARAIIDRAADGSLGGVVALDVFEHIPQTDLRELLIACRRKLSLGGQVIFRVPNAGSALGLINQNGDMSHVNAFNEVSVRQLAFDTGLKVGRVAEEPFGYPRSIAALAGIALWPAYKAAMRAVFAAYGQRPSVITPNLICVLKKD